MQEELFIKFAEFEEKVGEVARARAIYKYALDHIPRAQANDVYRRFVTFEKQHGDREGIEVSSSCESFCIAAVEIIECFTALLSEERLLGSSLCSSSNKDSLRWALSCSPLFHSASLDFTCANCLQEVIVSERRFQYEADVKANPQNYDSWFDYIRLEESTGDHEKVSSRRNRGFGSSNADLCYLSMALLVVCLWECANY